MHANFSILTESTVSIIIKDKGPWDKHKTITNDVEWVLESLKDKIINKKLFYFDSENDFAEINHKNGVFINFKHALLENVLNFS